MNLKVFGLFCFVVVVLSSCGSGVEVLRSGNTINASKPIDYFSPVYSFSHDSIANSRQGVNLVKYSNHYLDSLLLEGNERFNIGTKIQLDNESAFVNYAEETSNLFEKVIKEGSIENIPIPSVIDSILRARSSAYAFLFYQNPTYGKEDQQYLHGITMGNGATLILKQNDLHLILLDVEKREIAFYGKARGKGSRPDVKELLSLVQPGN